MGFGLRHRYRKLSGSSSNMKEANDIFEKLCLGAVIVACIIVFIGIYPYIVSLLRGIHAGADSVSDLYHNYKRRKQNNNNYLIMNKKNNPNEHYINPEDIKIDRSELEVTLPEVALSNQFKAMEVNQLQADMIGDINRRRPITEWGRKRLNEKLRDTSIRMELTIDQIGLHNTMIKEAAKLEATMLHAPQLVQHELEMMILDNKIAKEEKIASFMETIDEIESRKKFRDIEIKIKDAEHDRYVMETKLSELEKKAKINEILATTDQERARASLMQASLRLFEEGELSEKLQAYLIISVFNPGEQSFIDSSAEEDLKSMLAKEKKFDAEKKKWDAKSAREDYKHKKSKIKRQKKQQKDGDKPE